MRKQELVTRNKSTMMKPIASDGRYPSLMMQHRWGTGISIREKNS
ncbi:hypothetical protein BH09BAC1_BH09BAC1_18650 [soil metagenome]